MLKVELNAFCLLGKYFAGGLQTQLELLPWSLVLDSLDGFNPYVNQYFLTSEPTKSGDNKIYIFIYMCQSWGMKYEMMFSLQFNSTTFSLLFLNLGNISKVFLKNGSFSKTPNIQDLLGLLPLITENIESKLFWTLHYEFYDPTCYFLHYRNYFFKHKNSEAYGQYLEIHELEGFSF